MDLGNAGWYGSLIQSKIDATDNIITCEPQRMTVRGGCDEVQVGSDDVLVKHK